MKEKYKDEEWLQEKYVDERLSVKEIAERQAITSSTIYYWLGKFDIELIDKTIDKIEVSCDECGKQLFKYPQKVERNEYNFCSKDCEVAWKSKNLSGNNSPMYKKIEVECHNCGNKFLVAPYYDKRTEKNFCSESCWGEWISKKRRGKNHPNWKGGNRIYYYGPNWHSQRRKVLERDNYRCQNCGKKKDNAKLDIHHIIPFRKYRLPIFLGAPIRNILAEFNWEKANRLENLITLCSSCHKKAEGKDINDFLNE